MNGFGRRILQDLLLEAETEYRNTNPALSTENVRHRIQVFREALLVLDRYPVDLEAARLAILARLQGHLEGEALQRIMECIMDDLGRIMGDGAAKSTEAP